MEGAVAGFLPQRAGSTLEGGPGPVDATVRIWVILQPRQSSGACPMCRELWTRRPEQAGRMLRSWDKVTTKMLPCPNGVISRNCAQPQLWHCEQSIGFCA
jgi:hypothetical protein